MCFYLSMSKDAQTLKNRFKAEFPREHDFVPAGEFNGFAHPELPVISQDHPERLSLFRWGLVPAWVNDPDRAKVFRSRTLNARSETAFNLPSYRMPIRQQRCLIPADAFYEWEHQGKNKIKYRIRCKEPVFCFAGVWDLWTDPVTHQIWQGFSILTTPANPLIARIHNSRQRMPLILPKKKEEEWLDSERKTPRDLQDLLTPFNEKEMSAERL
ncbi:MAG: SOS response-associated peptidase [Candidatus Marinimicrobia bacterium]|jgi:putative SOS response-associated peptidase YedK|nr:SOS response-associated peptidase [Candidatus Neomarinimicrobiota bacterium]MDD5709292.1 SOS response-associated peptidase [Candidatus Neomarinimicrobiota bacterium]MDX9777554.1 SOS response-associated peptidase [bacterium]